MIVTDIPAGIPPGMDATNRLFEQLVLKGDMGGLDKVYTADANILPPGSPMVSGIVNIQAFWGGAAAAMGITKALLHTVQLDLSGDSAVEIGNAELFTTASPEPAILKYVVYWKQQDGAWLWNIDIWN